MPSTTLANGTKRSSSRPGLSFRLMNTSVARVLGPDCAKLSVPRRFFSLGGIVHNELLAPRAVHIEIPVDAELRDETRKHAMKPAFVVIVHPQKLVETSGGSRRPGLIDLHDEVALGGFEPGTIDLRNHHRLGGRLGAGAQRQQAKRQARTDPTSHRANYRRPRRPPATALPACGRSPFRTSPARGSDPPPPAEPRTPARHALAAGASIASRPAFHRCESWRSCSDPQPCPG